MTRSTWFTVAAAAAVCLVTGDATAQMVTAFQPMATFQAPVTQVVARPVIVSPGFAAPVATPHFVASPVIASSPVVQTSFYAPAATTCCSPVVAAPIPTVTYFRAPQVSWQPTPQVVTRHRPILGGSVSRVRNVWTPVVW